MVSIISKIRKRSGDVVDFTPDKILGAIRGAFREVQGTVAADLISGLTTSVVRRLEAAFSNRTPSVEDTQNTVERVLMEAGYFEVAKAYIIYRYEHAKRREEKIKEVLEKIDENRLMVRNRSGEREPFSAEKLKRSLAWAAKGYEDAVDVNAIALQCEAGLYDNIPVSDISRALILTVRSLIEQDPAYSKIAARLLLRENYREIIGGGIDWKQLDVQYRAAFVASMKEGVRIGKLDARVLEFNLEALASTLVPERDDLLWYLGVQTLYDRYVLMNVETKARLETPQMLWMRVAIGLALNEQQREARAAEFYEVLSTLRFVSSTPTLFHAGTSHPQLSSCYLNTVEDSLDHIFKVIGDNAQLSKWSGGIGTDWTNLRGTGALIRGTGVESQGVIPFLKVANDTTVAINRSGRRRGAACVYLETWHIDIEHFLELRKNTGDERRRTHDMDTANWIPDLFMKRVREDGVWTLFSPDETPDLHHIYGQRFDERYRFYEAEAAAGRIKLFKTITARDLWKKMLSMLFETGHPWITFKDPSNVRSPQDHTGVVHNSNLCTEITLNTSATETAVCNLGSVNLGRHIRNHELDLNLLRDTVTTAMRMLDNVIDVNYYPTAEARASNLRHRPVGLGIMGFQDALYQMDINFDSDAMVEFADSSMEAVSYHAILASSGLAAERGVYETYRGSKWDRNLLPLDTLDLLEQERGLKIPVPRASIMDWSIVRDAIRRQGMRNSNCLAIAPTATISNISGCVPSIEPIYKNIYVKANVSGDFTVINNHLVEELKRIGLWDFEMLGKLKYRDGSVQDINEIPSPLRAKYKEAFEIDAEWLLRAAARRSKWIDQSQSLNIFFSGASGKMLSDTYLAAWELGLKTTYYLRSLAASQVEKSTLGTEQYGSTHTRKAQEPVVIAAAPQPVAVALSSSPPSDATASPSTLVAVAAARPQSLKQLCRIDDPNCESCQ